ncbi:MAG TPA: type I polyketide synthase, partial [Nevskiaceae bacterium]|nr:type I polyketide synthase [Nevskiaceae bacterium]
MPGTQNPARTKTPLDIAVIGLAGVYPGARDASAFWRNICAKVDAISDADEQWTGPYFEADTKADDRTYTTKGGFLKELAEVDPIEVGVMPNVAAGSDPDHLIALKVARDALDDAGYLKRKFDGSRAGVVVARGTYGNRGMAGMLARGFFMDQMMDVVRHLRPDLPASEIRALQNDLKKQLPPYGGDMVGVLTPNVIASLIANRLDLMGPAYIVDAACASSLIAVDAAVQELVTRRCDMMLVGGTHVQTPPQLYIQFCQIGALSRDRLRPFQKGAEGTLLGEGCGMLVLKRLADAEKDGDRIYAVIKGIGVSSDGKAKGLLAPRLEGEVLAMRRAYESSGIDPMTVDLVEAHGTGTSVGDKTEIESLTQIYGGRGARPQVAISAVKSMIGHCLPGTGAASMIKTSLALHHKVLPPMLCDEPDPALGLDKTPFYINNETRPWVHGRATPRRAGVNAFGFGGINAHVILEEYRPAAKTMVPVLNVPDAPELFLLAADSNDRLAELAQMALAHLRSPNPPSVAELCAAAAPHTAGRHRLAIVCESAADLVKKLEGAAEKIARADVKPYKTRNGVMYGAGPAPGKLCILFPGEGSQYPGMLADLCLRFPQVRDWFDFIEENARARGSRSRAEILFPAPTVLDDAAKKALEDALYEMDIGAESVFAASLGLQALFDDLDVKPDAMLGHSTGENTALTACRLRRFEKREEVASAVQEINAIYRRLEAEGKIVHGTLLTVGGLTAETRAKLLADLGNMQLAMDNCPNQIVLFGTDAEAEALRETLSADGAICQKLPFGRAYHTPLFKPLADAFRDYFRELDFGPGR